MRQQFNNYIAGQWIDSPSYVDNINPSDIHDIIGSYARGDAGQAELAIEAAKTAFPSWSHSGIDQRNKVLKTIAA